MDTTEATQDLYLSYIRLPIDPACNRRMSTARAAKLAGVTDRTVRNWRSNPAFAARERAARESGMVLARQQAQSAATVLLAGAVQALAASLYDPAVSPAVRARVAGGRLAKSGIRQVVRRSG
jgi:hypothetical protein